MEHESRINAALGKIVRNFNLLELNIGLCLRYLENPSAPNASHKFLNKAGMPQAIKRLKKLLDECELVPDTIEFDEWMVRTEKIRALRNYYVHAIWEYLPLRKEAPLGFRIPRGEKRIYEAVIKETCKLKTLKLTQILLNRPLTTSWQFASNTGSRS